MKKDQNKRAIDKEHENIVRDVFAGKLISAEKNRLHSLYFKKKGDNKATLLEAIARSEEICARRLLFHLRGGVSQPDKHMEEISKQKVNDFEKVFSELSRIFKDAGHKTLLEAMEQFGAVSRIHHALIQESLEGNGTGHYFVCGVCGYIKKDDFEKKCPVCGAVAEKFQEVKG